MKVTVFGTILDDDGMCKLVKNKVIDYAGEENLDEPTKVYRLLRDVFQMDKQTEEYLYMLCMSGASRLLGVFELTHGTVNLTFVNNREIFQKALLCNASSIIIAHNHPSGQVKPSTQDFSVYRQVRQAADLMGIPLVDSIIVGETYYSFYENE